MSSRVVALTLAVASGCMVEHRVAVSGRELHRGLWALRTAGQAELVVVHQRGSYTPTTAVEVVSVDQPLTSGRERLTPRALSLGCLDLPPQDERTPTDADCPLVQARDVDFELRSGLERDWRPLRKAVVPTLVLGGLGAAVGCELGCADGSNAKLAADGTLGALGVAFLGLIAWGVYDCMGHWGEPGCRD